MWRQTFIAAVWLWPSVCMRYHVIGLLGQSTKAVKSFSTMDRERSLI